MTLPAYAMSSLSFPEMYERWLVPSLFRPWAEILLQRLELTGNGRFLDIACGTGIVARLARERLSDDARVVGVDLSPQMLALARQVAPDIEWREGNASALPVKDGEQFDVVVCQQGLQFFPEKPAAVREMRRVLAPSGRLGVATWCSVEEMPLFKALQQVAEGHLGTIIDQRHSFGDAAALETLIAEAGFRSVQVERMSSPVHFADGSAFVRLNTMALVGMSAAAKEMSDEQRSSIVTAIVTESASVLAPYMDGALTFETGANVATATI